MHNNAHIHHNKEKVEPVQKCGSVVCFWCYLKISNINYNKGVATRAFSALQMWRYKAQYLQVQKRDAPILFPGNEIKS